MSDRNVKAHLVHFNITGFSNYDDAEAFGELKMRLKLNISLGTDNKFDPNAVMISYKDCKLGYVPKAVNEIFGKLLRAGTKNTVTLIQRLNRTDHPEQRVRVVTHTVGERDGTRQFNIVRILCK